MEKNNLNSLTVKEPACQVCGETLIEREVVLCSRCKTPHHLECWRFNKGCSVYGCGNRTSIKPLVPLNVQAGESFEFISKVYYMAAATRLGLLCFAFIVGLLIFGTLLSSFTFLVTGLVLLVFCWGNIMVQQFLLEQQLKISPKNGTIDRSLQVFGFCFSSTKNWLKAEDIVELHYHHEVLNASRSTQAKLSIFALLTSGARLPLYVQLFNPLLSKENKARHYAERLGEFADCTIREFDTGEPPLKAEIKEALRMKKLETNSASDSVEAHIET